MKQELVRILMNKRYADKILQREGKSLEKHFKNLITSLPDYVLVVYQNPFGFIADDICGTLIFVSPLLTPKERLFTLVHEIGHFFFIRGSGFVKSKKVVSERKANQRAVKILKFLGLDYEKEFYRFYSSIVKKLRKINDRKI